MKYLRRSIAALVVLGVVGITAAGYTRQKAPATRVRLAEVKVQPIARTITAAGKLQATTSVKISSNLSGDLVALHVKAGEVVKQGQVLGRLDRRRFEAALRQAQASAQAARSEAQAAQIDHLRATQDAERVSRLVAQGLAPKAELERASAERDVAASRVATARERATSAAASAEQAQDNLQKTTLISPIDGTVLDVSREVGERVRGSDFSEDVVMTIAALASMEVKIEVGEHDVVYLREGQRAWIGVDALEEQTFEGTVSEIAQKALVKNANTESEVTTFPVTVTLNTRPTGALTGMNAEVRILAESKERALVVPAQAVTLRPERSLKDRIENPEQKQLVAPGKAAAFARVVFVYDSSGAATLRRVKTGIASDTEIEVLEGVKEGDRVVEGPWRTLSRDLKDGDRLEEERTPNKPGQAG